ncbi:MAG: hypothetical protein C0511_01525 [Hyphomicrobium sp.]|nr:hypothetical protein [Hyphomicrobium sp.]PPC83766.1 MAG: hypothetical protein CTY40_01520 [Hyphomicrobium sp.]
MNGQCDGVGQGGAEIAFRPTERLLCRQQSDCGRSLLTRDVALEHFAPAAEIVRIVRQRLPLIGEFLHLSRQFVLDGDLAHPELPEQDRDRDP